MPSELIDLTGQEDEASAPVATDQKKQAVSGWPSSQRTTTLDFVHHVDSELHIQPKLYFTQDGTWLLAACQISSTQIQVTAWNKTEVGHSSHSMRMDLSKVLKTKSQAANPQFTIHQVDFLCHASSKQLFLQVSFHSAPSLVLIPIDIHLEGENLLGDAFEVGPCDKEQKRADLGFLTKDGIFVTLVRGAQDHVPDKLIAYDLKSNKCVGSYEIPRQQQAEARSSTQLIRSGDHLLVFVKELGSKRPVRSLYLWSGDLPLSSHNMFSVSLPPDNFLSFCRDNPSGVIAASQVSRGHQGNNHNVPVAGMVLLQLEVASCSCKISGRTSSTNLSPLWGASPQDLYWSPTGSHLLALHNTWDHLALDRLVSVPVMHSTDKSSWEFQQQSNDDDRSSIAKLVAAASKAIRAQQTKTGDVIVAPDANTLAYLVVESSEDPDGNIAELESFQIHLISK